MQVRLCTDTAQDDDNCVRIITMSFRKIIVVEVAVVLRMTAARGCKGDVTA